MLDPNNDRQTDFSNMFKEGRVARGFVRRKSPKARPRGLALEEGAVWLGAVQRGREGWNRVERSN